MQQKLKKTVRVAKAPGSGGGGGPRRGRQGPATAALTRKSAVAVKGRRATLLKKVSKAMVETTDPDQNSNASSTSSSEQAIKDLLDEVNQVIIKICIASFIWNTNVFLLD